MTTLTLLGTPSQAPFIQMVSPPHHHCEANDMGSIPDVPITESIKHSGYQESLSVTSSEDTLDDWQHHDLQLQPHVDECGIMVIDAKPANYRLLDEEAAFKRYVGSSPTVVSSRKMTDFPKKHDPPPLTPVLSLSSPTPTTHRHHQHRPSHSPDPSESSLLGFSQGRGRDVVRFNTSKCHQDQGRDTVQAPYTSRLAAAAFAAQSPAVNTPTPLTMSSQSPSPTLSQRVRPVSSTSSRLKSAFQRLRPISHPSITENDTPQPTPSKSSLAEKIKNRLHLKKSLSLSPSISSSATSPTTPPAHRHSPPASATHLHSTQRPIKSILKSQPTQYTASFRKPRHPYTTHDGDDDWPLYTVQQQQQQQQHWSRKSQQLQPYHPMHHHTNSQPSPPKPRAGTVRFAKVVSVRETFSQREYNRSSDPNAVCMRLSAVLAQQIKDELNSFKLYEMRVHEQSRENTHFF